MHVHADRGDRLTAPGRLRGPADSTGVRVRSPRGRPAPTPGRSRGWRSGARARCSARPGGPSPPAGNQNADTDPPKVANKLITPTYSDPRLGEIPTSAHPIIWLEIRLLRSAPKPLTVAPMRPDQGPSI